MDPKRRPPPAVREGYEVIVTVTPVRWKPYHAKHVAQTGQKGRWQRANEWGGWDNCEPPEQIYASPPDVKIIATD